jgi:transposase
MKRGGLTARERRDRERARLVAAELFAQKVPQAEIARLLAVSPQAVSTWHRQWSEGGTQALLSAGPSGARPYLDDEQVRAVLRALEQGPAAHGWADQRWTLARITPGDHRGHRGELSRPGRGMAAAAAPGLVLAGPGETGDRARRGGDRHLAHRGVAAGKRSAAAAGAWICFADETGASLSPPVRKTWSPRGRTPVLRVPGGQRRRISLAGVCCYRPGEQAKLIYATHTGGFTHAEFPALLARLHRQLAAPIVLVWDNLSGHRTGTTRKFVAATTSWLTVVQLPGYAPELNPAQGAWAHLKNGILANLAARTLTELTQAVRRGLRHIQRHPALLTGFLAGTGLVLDPTPSTP